MEREDKTREWLNEEECLPYIDLLTKFISNAVETIASEEGGEGETDNEETSKNKGMP